MKDILLKEKITKQVFSPIRNKEDAAFHSVFLFLHENAEICEWKEDGWYLGQGYGGDRTYGSCGRDQTLPSTAHLLFSFLGLITTSAGHVGPATCLWGRPHGHAANSSPWDVGLHALRASSDPGLRNKTPYPSPSPLAPVEMWLPRWAACTTGMRPTEDFLEQSHHPSPRVLRDRGMNSHRLKAPSLGVLVSPHGTHV